MRPRKYILSERVAPPAISAQVLTLDAGADTRYRPNTAEPPTFKVQRPSKTRERNDLDVVPSPEQQRLTADDLQNVLCSTDVAIILLDTDLTIRFFTPAIARLFNVIPGDIGRPLTELNSLASEAALVNDATKVLQSLEPIERDVEALSGEWHVRRISPYRPEGQAIEGIVITFVDITRQKLAAAALECARVRADSANVAKSRFLAAASHDLRQPLQTLVLLQELLSKVVIDDKAKNLVDRIDHTIGSMSGMLNALLDINRIEAGTVRAEFETFPIGALLNRVKADLACQAEAQQIALDMLPCSFFVRSDPRLLEQMVRNLVSNAIKYTKRGRVLVGCRHRNGILSIQIWDTGVGIPENQLQNIFEEYHQLDNSARNRSRGLGLGLSIVKRLGVLLNHPVRVRSELGKGSVFSIEVEQHIGGTSARRDVSSGFQVDHHDAARGGGILVVAGEPELRDLLETGLCAAGHDVVTAFDGIEALRLLENGAFDVGLLISDFNLPNGIDGICLAEKIRAKLHRTVPVIILSGDISTLTLRDIALQKCEHINKPTSRTEVLAAISRLVPVSVLRGSVPRLALEAATKPAPVVYVVDDDRDLRRAIRGILEHDGRLVEDYEDAESFLATYRPGRAACLLIDADLPGISGLNVLKRLKDAGHPLPAIMITGRTDVPTAVEAMKAGASDFLEKPIRGVELVRGVARALGLTRDSGKSTGWRKGAAGHLSGLTRRQQQILEMVLAGHPSKNIAVDLGISRRTVESHRASIMKKAGVRSLPALARLALAAAGGW